MGKESSPMDGFWVKFNFLAEIKPVDMRVYTGKIVVQEKIHHDIFVHANVLQASHLHSLTKAIVFLSLYLKRR